MYETHQKRLKKKQLLRTAAETVDVHCPVPLGCCVALNYAFFLEYGHCCEEPAYKIREETQEFFAKLYRPDSPLRDHDFWMGRRFTPDQQQHRIMALLFAAEAYDDMEGV